MKTAPPLVLLLVVCWPGEAGTDPAPRLVQKHGAASAWFTVRADDPLAIRLSDEILVALRVEAPAPLEVQLLDKLELGEVWDVEEKQTPAMRPVGEKGAALWQMAFLAAPLLPGEHALALPALQYRSGEEAWQEVKWTPLQVQVTTAVKKADLESARDITPIEDLPPLPESPGWTLWIAVGTIATLLGAAALLLRRRRVEDQRAVTTEQWARAELEQLAAQAPADAEAVERFHRELAAVLRQYLEQSYQLPAERRTTAEFLEVLRTGATLAPELQTTLGDILRPCDLAKFARVVPPVQECHRLVTEARAFVEACSSLRVRSSLPR